MTAPEAADGGSSANTVDVSGTRRTERSLPGKKCCIEQDPECAERLAAPFGAETNQHDVTGVERHVERRRFALQILLADEIPGQQRRARFLVARDHGSLESLERLGYGAALDEARRLVRPPPPP